MVRESFIYIASKALPSVVGFATGIALTWLLAPADYGIYGLGTALVTLISAAFFSWHALSFMRFYQSGSENPNFMPTIMQSFLLLCLVSGVVGLAIAASGILSPDYQSLIWICVPGCWCFSWFELAARMQVARFRPLSYFWMNLARNTGILVFGVALAWLTRSPHDVLIGAFLAMLLAGIAFHSGGFDLRPGRFDRGTAVQLLTFGWPVAIVQVIVGSSFAIDRILLEIFSGKAQVGFYTVAYSLAQTTIATIGAGIDSAVYSRAVRAVDRGDPEAFRSQLERNCTLLLALMVPAAVGAAMVAPALARLCVGPDYVGPVSGLIAWMAVAALIQSFRAFYVDHAFHFGKTTTRLTVVIATMAAANVVADLVLIPKFGATGAAMAGIVAASIGLVHGVIVSRSVLLLPFPGRDIGKIAVAALAMALFLWPLHGRTGIGSLVVQVVGGALVFGSSAVVTDLMGIRKTMFAALVAFRRPGPRRGI
jgi:O-antigen/teichoic acid export membrane protein